MVKELGIIRSGSGGIIGCKSAADQVYYYNFYRNLKIFLSISDR